MAYEPPDPPRPADGREPRRPPPPPDPRWFLLRWRSGQKAPYERIPMPGAENIPDWHGLFSPDGKRLVRWRPNAGPYLWDSVKGRSLGQLDKDVGYGVPVALSPDGRRLVLLSRDGGVHLYETEAGKHLKTLIPDAPRRDHWWPTIAPDNRVVVVSTLHDLLVLDLRTSKQVALIEGVRGPTCFSEDGKSLACADRPAIRLIDTKTWKVIRTFEATGEWRGVCSLAFSPDGKRIALAGDHAVSLWDVATGKRSGGPAGHRDSRVLAGVLHRRAAGRLGRRGRICSRLGSGDRAVAARVRRACRRRAGGRIFAQWQDVGDW